MKTLIFSTALTLSALTGLAQAIDVPARYVKYEFTDSTYNYNNNDVVGAYEIEIFSDGSNVAPSASVTFSSQYSNYGTRINDGDYGTWYRSTGPVSPSTPEWIQFDLGSTQNLQSSEIHLLSSYQNFAYSYSVLVSTDGSTWTEVANHSFVSGIVKDDYSAPWVSIVSAAMREGTTYMDVVYRVDDLDDATVKTRALAFVDGERSFAKVLRPVTFVEGTDANLGDTIATGVNHTLTWDVATDWEVDLGQVKFEVLAMDDRSLLPFDWVTIPAAGEYAETTVSKNSPTDTETLNALFWQYADGDTGISLANGVLSGSATSGIFNQIPLVDGSAMQAYGTPYIFKKMNLKVDNGELAYIARANLEDTVGWHASNSPYTGTPIISSWGQESDNHNEFTPPPGLANVKKLAAGNNHSVALRLDGTLTIWGINSGYTTTDITDISVSWTAGLGLKKDGTVFRWGGGIGSPPVGLSDVTQVSAGRYHGMALKADGTVVAWGSNSNEQATVPADLNNVVLIAAGNNRSLAVKADGTTVGWGSSFTPPSDMTGVTKVIMGTSYILGLKIDGTVVAWSYSGTPASVPEGLTDVVQIDSGESGQHLALKSNGTVVAWGSSTYGLSTLPAIVTAAGASHIATGWRHSLVLTKEVP
ncbi:MAG: discoidin domain-containing protein [Luteolibacter sp.]